MDEGELVLHRDGQRIEIHSGSAVIIPPGEYRLSVGNAGFCRKRHLGISGMILANNLAAMSLDKVSVLPDFLNPECEELYGSLLAMTSEKRPESVREYCALTYRMLLLLSHCAIQKPYPAELQRAISFIDWNFSRSLSLTEICRHANCGRSTLQWQFKHYLNSSPVRYLIEIRMKYAARVLVNTSLTIKNIAEKCGYSNQLYFSNAFCRYYGCSPREYRKNSGV